MISVFHSYLFLQMLAFVLSRNESALAYYNRAVLQTRRLSQSTFFTNGSNSRTHTNPYYLAKENNELEKKAPIGLYIHIPYCRRRCRYCNFAIVPIGRASEETAKTTASRGFHKMDQVYLDTLQTEIRLVTNNGQYKKSTEKIPLTSIYFGGGTPSLAPVSTIRTIMDTLLYNEDSPFRIDTSTAEITMEMDPGTFSLEKLQHLQKIGINRISLGVQSFDDDLLESIGRTHRVKDIMDSLDMLREVYGNDGNQNEQKINYSIDLISGLPGLSRIKWTETLETATKLDPPPSHISVYDLQIETGTVFGRWYSDGRDDDDDDDDDHDVSAVTKNAMQRTRSTSIEAGELHSRRNQLPSEKDCAFMYKYASGYLRSKGYEHYEVSSYALSNNSKKSNRSQHNQIYWSTNGKWYAFGMGATSFLDENTLTARPKKIHDYIQWVKTLKQRPLSNNDHDVNDDHLTSSRKLDDEDLLTEIVMKRLRTSDGLDLNWIAKKFGTRVVQSIIRGARLGMDLGFVKRRYDNEIEDSQKINNADKSENHGTLYLVSPDGFLYSNTIISSIFVELDDDDDDIEE